MEFQSLELPIPESIKREERLHKPPRSSKKYAHKNYYDFLGSLSIPRNNFLASDKYTLSPLTIINTLLIKMPPGAIIAGGYLTNLFGNISKPAKDVDIFFERPEDFNETLELFLNPKVYSKDEQFYWLFKAYFLDIGVKNKDTSYGPDPSNIVTAKSWIPGLPDIQLVRIGYYDNAEHVIDNFDFTVTQFAVSNSGYKREVVFNPDALQHLKDRELHLANMEHPRRCRKRIAHYEEKGFHVVEDTLNKLKEAESSSPKTSDEWKWYEEGFKNIDYALGHPVEVLENGNYGQVLCDCKDISDNACRDKYGNKLP